MKTSLLNHKHKREYMDNHYLQRFKDAQERDYEIALGEIKNGKKQSHWMWYIFPQLKGLGSSSASNFYGLKDLSEAIAYLSEPILEYRLREISKALLILGSSDALIVMGSPDHFKLKSSMTLFSLVPNSDPIFTKVLEKFFQGRMSRRTLKLLNINNAKDK